MRYKSKGFDGTRGHDKSLNIRQGYGLVLCWRTHVNPTRKRGTQDNRAYFLRPSLTRRVMIYDFRQSLAVCWKRQIRNVYPPVAR
jgi:hypothetical protein